MTNKQIASALAVVSLFATLLLGSPLHDWINDIVKGNGTARVIVWVAVLLCVALVVGIAVALLTWRERKAIRKRVLGLADLTEDLVICQQDGQQLQDEAAYERNDEVDFEYYCKMARTLSRNLDLLWRGSDVSALLRQEGVDLSGVEALLDAIDRHYQVEIGGPLGSSPAGPEDKKDRIRQAGFGGRCISLLFSQLLRVISRIMADYGVEGGDYNGKAA